jgi:uncharacterized SAM-dependent methyltransferase
MIYIYKAELVRVVDGDTVDLIIDLGFDTSRKGKVLVNDTRNQAKRRTYLP